MPDDYPPGPINRSPEEVQQILASHARWPSEHHTYEHHTGLPQVEFRMSETEALRMEVRGLRAEVVRLHAWIKTLVQNTEKAGG